MQQVLTEANLTSMWVELSLKSSMKNHSITAVFVFFFGGGGVLYS